jgi:hypothetical protein
MISMSKTVGYIHEPFNPWHTKQRQGICHVEIPHWFLYINEENGPTYHDAIEDMLAFRYHLLGGIKGIRSWEDAKQVRWQYKSFRRFRKDSLRPLIKDPFALLSVEWLADMFDFDMIIMIRHPAAVVSSIKRLGWGSPFRHLLRQPLLMRDYLSPFEAELKAYAGEKQDIVDQTILIWRILYSVVSEYKKKRPNWIFLRHEDIASAPLAEFEKLFAQLGLNFTPQVRSAIQKHSAESNPVETPAGNAYDMKRDSRSLVTAWKNRLTPEEVQRVKEGTWAVAKEFYTEEDW